MQQHLFYQHLTGVLHTEGHHSQAVADEDHLDAGMVRHEGAGEVVGGHHGDGIPLGVHLGEGREGDLLDRLLRLPTEWRMRRVPLLGAGGDTWADGGANHVVA